MEGYALLACGAIVYLIVAVGLLMTSGKGNKLMSLSVCFYCSSEADIKSAGAMVQ